MKNLRVDSAGGTLLSTKKLKRVLSKLEYGKGSPDQITADVLKEPPPDCLQKLAKIAFPDVLGHALPREVDVRFDGDGCNEPGRVQADRWVVRDGYECVQTPFVPQTRRCWFVLSCLEIGRKKWWWCSWT